MIADQEIEISQKHVESNIQFNKAPKKVEVSEAFVKLKSLIPEIKGAFGSELAKTATSIVEFMEDADLAHPEISKVIPAEQATALVEFLDVLAYAKKQKYKSTTSNIQDMVRLFAKEKLSIFEGKDKAKDYPACFVRLFKNTDRKNIFRSMKTPKTIGASSTSDSSAWGKHEPSFMSYCPNNNYLAAEIQKARVKAKAYDEKRVPDLRDNILETVKQMEQRTTDNYYGCIKIGIPEASVVLAKAHKFLFGQIADTANYSIVPDPETVAKIGVDASWVYRSRGYNYFDFVKMCPAPKSVANIIKYMEEHPDTGGKAIFDHFLVLVPGFSVSQVQKEGSKTVFDKIKLGNLSIGTEASVTPAEMEFDQELVKRGIVKPIVLAKVGAKDMYFISYFV